MIRKFTPLLLILSCLSLSACSSVSKVGDSIRNIGKKPQRVALKAPTTTAVVTSKEVQPQNLIVEKNKTPIIKESQSIDRAIQTALTNAEAAGNKNQVLSILGQLQSRTPDDPALSVRYARALREHNQGSKAKKILTPFINGGTANVGALTEMAMIELGTSNYAAAKNFAMQATEIDPQNARSYLALGTAQDALQEHDSAEQSFRQGLEHWQGDPSPILNNLALNLASQGYLDESLSLLERALKISPNRLELERNRRIIATLLETANPLAPSPTKKPDIVIPNTANPNFKVVTPIKKAPVETAPLLSDNIYDEVPLAEPTVKKITLTPITNNITSNAARSIDAETQKTLDNIIDETVQ